MMIVRIRKLAKKRHFFENLETSEGNPCKTWDLVNERSSRMIEVNRPIFTKLIIELSIAPTVCGSFQCAFR